MRTLNLSGFAKGDSISLSVSQNAITAGPINVQAWGGGGDGGIIAIVAEQSVSRVAPESVRFRVDLSASTFDTAGPTGDDVYDARMHDLIYLWNFGDPGTWSAPVNVLGEWKDRNIGKGSQVAHVYRTPKPAALGTGNGYTASVMVIEPSSGRIATTSIEVFVEDPSAYYSGIQTICINPMGDADFTGAPSGAVQVNADRLMTYQNEGDALWEVHQTGNPKRWLFKRGAQFDVSLRLWGPDDTELTFGAYGTGGRPVLNLLTGGGADPQQRMFSFSESWGGTVSHNGIAPELRLIGLRLQHTFNPVVGKASDYADVAQALSVNSDFDIVIHDCEIDGFGGPCIYVQTDITSRRGRMHFDDSVMTNFGGQYAFMCVGSLEAQSYVAVTGVRMNLPGDAIADSTGLRSPMRLQMPMMYIAGCDLFTTATQYHHIKCPDTPNRDGYYGYIHSCSFEGGAGALVCTSNPTVTPRNGPYVHNIVFDGNVVVASWSMGQPIRLIGSGVTVRNNLFIYPAISLAGNGIKGVVNISREATPTPPPAFVANAPIDVYNNTFRFDKTYTQAGSVDYAPVMIHDDAGGLMTNLNDSNNIVHMPSLVIGGNPSVPFTGFAPLSDAALWTPRNLGYRDPLTLTLDTSLATPVNAVKDTRPQIGSAALGAALNGSVSYIDIQLQDRSEPPSVGAWEAE